MPGTAPTHKIRIKLPGTSQWLDIGPLWQKANGDFSGRANLPNCLDDVPAIVVKAERPAPKPQAVEQPKPAA